MVSCDGEVKREMTALPPAPSQGQADWMMNDGLGLVSDPRPHREAAAAQLDCPPLPWLRVDAQPSRLAAKIDTFEGRTGHLKFETRGTGCDSAPFPIRTTTRPYSRLSFNFHPRTIVFDLEVWDGPWLVHIR